MKRVYFAPSAYADFAIAGPDDDAGYVTIYLPHHSASLEVRVPTCPTEPVTFNGHPAVYTDEISDKEVAMQDELHA